MKTRILNIIAILMLFFVSVEVASAQNIQFTASPTITDNGTTVTVLGSISGVDANQPAVIVLNAPATYTTTCTNPGGNVVPGQTKTRTETVKATGNFTSGANGIVVFNLTTPVPPPADCPNTQWTATVTEADFSNMKLIVNGQELNLR